MWLLQLPVWSYFVVGAATFAIALGLPRALAGRRVRREDERRARAAASILRFLTDAAVKRAIGIPPADR